LKEASRLIAAGHNPQELRRGIESAGAEIIAELDKLSESIEGKTDRVAEVATISAGDETIGKLIASVIEKIGKDGVVTVEASQGMDLEAEVVEGFTFDRGFVSQFFVTDVNRQEAVYEKPAIIITDKKVSNVQEFLPILDKLVAAGKKEAVLIADEVEGEALSILVLNKLKGAFNTVAVKVPAYGDRRKEILNDIAILTGATVISEDQGYTFENVGLEVVGTARKVIVGKDSTTIIEGAGKAADIKKRIALINTQNENAVNKYDKEHNEKRAASLSGKVAVIKVGGTTETEIEEKKYRVDDAVAATKAALAEGIVAGGGVTLVNLSANIKVEGSDSVTAGRQILKNALKQPFLQVTANAGLNSEALLAQVESAKPGFGINVNKPEKGLIDVKKDGVIDPTRVVKEAVMNAVSIASTAATMGALVVDIPEKETPAAGGMGGGMGY
jgi:chaperonin GroEL